jgi:hypothetical protein
MRPDFTAQQHIIFVLRGFVFSILKTGRMGAAFEVNNNKHFLIYSFPHLILNHNHVCCSKMLIFLNIFKLFIRCNYILTLLLIFVL